MNQNDHGLHLDEMIKLYQAASSSAEGQNQALKIILEYCCYLPKNQTEQNYDKNKRILSAYHHNYLDFMPALDEFSGLCFPRDKDSCYFFFPETKTFSPCVTVNRLTDSTLQKITANPPEGSVALCKIYYLDELNYISGQINYILNTEANVNGFKMPVYCIWEYCLELIAALHLFDVETLISDKSVVFLPDNHILDNFFLDKSSFLPRMVVGVPKFHKKINSLAALRQEQNEANLKIVNEYCRSFDQEYYRKLFEDFAKNKPGCEKIRILFYTSLFTTAVQYSTRDCHEGALELGLESRLFIDKDNVHDCSIQDALIEEIARFKPHIIFRINFSRYYWPKVPDNIIWISWWQDQMISAEHVKLIGQFDVFFKIGKNTFPEATDIYGIDPRRIHTQILAANLRMADKYQEEYSDSCYKADIAFITHAADITKGIEEYLKMIKLPDNNDQNLFREILTLTVQKYIDIIETSHRSYFDEYRFTDILAQTALEKNYDLKGVVGINPKTDYFNLRGYMGSIIHKNLAVKWLYEAGFNIKVWGRDWPDLDWAKPIAMGVAENEAIRKIHHNAPIGLSVNHAITVQHRTFEIMSCGALCLVEYLPPDTDFVPITDYFVENEDFVFFYNKKDLLDKVRYYLDNRAELKRIAENGKRKVYEKYSYTGAMRNMLNLTFKTVTHD